MRAVVITCSDSASRGDREDRSGPAVRDRLVAASFEVERVEIVDDDRARIAAAIVRASVGGATLIVTTGGTGIAPADVTPEATADVAEKWLPGFGETMRARSLATTRMAPLSRAGAATHGTALIVNLPGSPSGAVECLDAVIDLIPHALELLSGRAVGRHPKG